jgi:hypothetical protein
MAQVSKTYLEQNNLAVKFEPVEGSNQLRVLVGPALEGSDLDDLKKKLDTLGFPTFLKKY